MGKFLSYNTPTINLNVATGQTYYIIIGSIYNETFSFDLSLSCRYKGIIIDKFCDPTYDPDTNGLSTIINGAISPCIDPAQNPTVTVNHTVNIKTLNNKKLKNVTIVTGKCIKNIIDAWPNGEFSFYSNSCNTDSAKSIWQMSISNETIIWNFLPGSLCTNESGDGNDLNVNYSCASYTFGYIAIVDQECLIASGFHDELSFIGDNAPLNPLMEPSRITISSGINNCKIHREPIELTAIEQDKDIKLTWRDETPETGYRYYVGVSDMSSGLFYEIDSLFINPYSTTFSIILNKSKIVKTFGKKFIIKIRKKLWNNQNQHINVVPFHIKPANLSIIRFRDNGSAYLDLTSLPKNLQKISLLLSSGQQIFEVSLIDRNPQDGTVIEIPNPIPTGIYIVTLSYKSHIVTEKIIIN